LEVHFADVNQLKLRSTVIRAVGIIKQQ